MPLANDAHWAEGTVAKLDFAVLYRIGWEVTGIPKASPFLLVGLILPVGMLIVRRRRPL